MLLLSLRSIIALSVYPSLKFLGVKQKVILHNKAKISLSRVLKNLCNCGFKRYYFNLLYEIMMVS